ncbi:MAG: TRAP transporter substrate-binding protein DctP [Alphaproteobacteria bacterium]|nr:TRAP transporter substrate-binding protein DctP [Alphaproteobacteria bacterium]MBV9863164.1 TRAP transporter substrate-binding protein DctP [Alphaproteobacteria bacterium]
MTPILRAFLMAAGVFVLVPTSRAQDKITLKIGTYFAPNHYIEVNTTKFFMDKMTELTEGRVQFEYYPAQQIGKAADLMRLAQAGVIDIAGQAIAYATDQLPLSGVIEMPGLFQTSCAGTHALEALVQRGKILNDQELAPAHVRDVFSIVLSPYKLHTRTKPIHELGDFAGLKLRVAGGGQEMMANALGAVPVEMPAPDVYQSLSRGTLDGVFFAYQSVRPYDVQTVTRFSTAGYSFGTSGLHWVISDRSWNRLPPDVQQALAKAGPMTSDNFCTYSDTHEDLDQAALVKDGITMVSLDEPQKEAVMEKLAPVAQEWAKKLDQRGKPGSEALKQLHEVLSASQ